MPTVPAVDTEVLASMVAEALRNSNMTPEQLRQRQERAWEAAKVMRKMIPQLSGFARAIARSNAVRVQIAPTHMSGSYTDGTTIYLAPPMELGDKVKHERDLCDIRGDDGLYLCPACRVRDKCMRTIYHELGHHCCESFQSLDESEQSRLAQRAVELGEPKAFVKWAQARLASAKSWEKSTYVGACKFVSPWFPTLINCLEDARVNLAMGAARPGVAQTFEANYRLLFEEGIDTPVGKVLWRDREPNSQIVMSLFAKASGYDYKGWFTPEIEQALSDKEIDYLCWKVTQTRSIKGVYELAMPMLVRLRELGYCRTPEDDDIDEPEPQQGQPGESGEQGESGDGQPSDSESSDGGDGSDSDDEGSESDGSQGSQDGDGPERSNDSESAPDGSGGGNAEDSSDESKSDSNASESEDGGSGSDQQADDDSGESGSESDEGSADGDESLDEGGDSGSSSDGPDGDDSQQDDMGSADADSGGNSDSDMASEPGGESESADGETGHSDNVTDELSDFDDPTSGGAGGEYSQRESERADSETEGMESGDLQNRQSNHSEDADDVEDDPDAEGNRGEGNIDLKPIDGQGGGESQDADLREGEGDETIDTGADEGDGGIKTREKPDINMMGTPEQAQSDLDELGDHGAAAEARKEQEELDRLLVDQAIMQSEYFETPSHSIAGVRIHEFDDRHRSSLAWNHNDGYLERYSRQQLGIAMPSVEERNLGRALMATRHAFDLNRQHKKERNLRSGRVDSRKLGRRAPVDDERLFQHRSRPGKRDYMVIIGIDISGSTKGVNLLLAKQAAMAQAELCNRVGVKFEVWAHTELPADFNPEEGTYGGQSMLDMFLVKLENEPWDSKRKERLAELGPCYGNLDGHSIEFYRKRLERSRATDKVLLYYTDGKMPASNYEEELEILQREIEVCKRLNIALMGVGIRTDSPMRHGLDTVQIDDADEVEKVVAHLEKKLHG